MLNTDIALHIGFYHDCYYANDQVWKPMVAVMHYNYNAVRGTLLLKPLSDCIVFTKVSSMIRSVTDIHSANFVAYPMTESGR